MKCLVKFHSGTNLPNLYWVLFLPENIYQTVKIVPKTV